MNPSVNAHDLSPYSSKTSFCLTASYGHIGLFLVESGHATVQAAQAPRWDASQHSVRRADRSLAPVACVRSRQRSCRPVEPPGRAFGTAVPRGAR